MTAVVDVWFSDDADGPAALAAVCQFAPALPCVFVTSNPWPYTDHDLLAIGATRILLKSSDADQFAVALA